jgi:ABC-type multidrug transport system permease subunit
MNTKVLMMSSALALGALGILLTFIPEEVAAYINLPVQAALLIQFLGAAYFGFAMLNWMAKGNLIGGIYSKPVALGNYAHFLVGVLAVGKLAIKSNGLNHLWIITIIYAIFAVLFGYISFSSPKVKST